MEKNFLEKRYFHDKKVERMKKKVFNYDKDEDNLKRTEDCICKYCYYIRTDDIVMDAFTTSHCQNCHKEQTFVNSNTDKFCIDCAKELGVCKHCGADMD